MADLVGLSGYSGVGKDEVAKVFVDEGYTRLAFADTLRQIAEAIDPYVELSHTGPDGHVYHYREFDRLNNIIKTFGWDKAKNQFADVRRLLQRLGTEAGRNIIHENIWVDTAFNNCDADKIVITDVRFPNEADSIKARDGVLIRINRPGVGPKNDHASETSLEDYPFDYHFDNDGTLEQLQEAVRSAFL